MVFNAPELSTSRGFEPPPGVCQSCGGKSDWRMLKVHQPDDQWRAAYAHNVLAGWEAGRQPDWSKISMKRGLRFEGWLEFCSNCELPPFRPTPSHISAEELQAHEGATRESIRAMLASVADSFKELPYDKNKRGDEL